MSADARSGPVIVLELNELCPPIIDRMMAAGELPNFKRLHDRSDVWITHTDDPSLEPWVQWPTFHTGTPQAVHGAAELDEGHLIKTRRIWDELAGHGFSSLVFGSMNGNTAGSDSVFLVPDPWSAGVRPTDPDFEGFHRFISFHVAEHTNPAAKPNARATLGFASFMIRHGLSPATISDAIAQLGGEKTAGIDTKWRRALILDLLMWDVFAQTWKKRRPDFATFFANSTAFLQHRYWRHMAPEAYQVKPSEAEMAAYGHAIEDSYRHMDRLVGKAFALGGPQVRLVLATALSQEANLRYEHLGGKFVYRPPSFRAVWDWAGGPKPISFEPVMTHQAWATFETEADAIAGETALDALQSNGRTIMEWRRSGHRIFFWCGLISRVEDGFTLTHGKTGAQIPFHDLFMLVGQVNNSQHCRDGAFWVQRAEGGPVIHDGRLPLENAYPILRNLFIPESLPAHMAAAGLEASSASSRAGLPAR